MTFVGRPRWWIGGSAVLGVLMLVPGPPLSSAAASSPKSPRVARDSFTDQSVHFQASGMTVYGTYRHPARSRGTFPAVLLIAGSGPTDRNGNSPEIPGPVDTLRTLADWLSEDGVASLRYDKLGSGQTGTGRFALNPDSIGIGIFEAEAAAALTFLAHQHGVDTGRLGVLGHSEGALFALLLATGKAGARPPVHALILLEPLSTRYLDVITEQVEAQVSAQQRTNRISASTAQRVRSVLASAVSQLRATGTVPPDLPYGIGALLSPVTAKFLSEADQYDPAQLAAELPSGTPALVSCGNADLQVNCNDVEHLVAGLTAGHAAVDFVHLLGVDHVLKVDPTGTSANYGKNLPFSSQLDQALGRWVALHLTTR